MTNIQEQIDLTLIKMFEFGLIDHRIDVETHQDQFSITKNGEIAFLILKKLLEPITEKTWGIEN